VRWNNFPRVADIKQLDNVGMTLHTALFLAYHEKTLWGVELDELYIIKKIIFSSLSDLVLSDINSGTKAHIKETNPLIFQQLYTQAFAFFQNQETPDFLLVDFEHTLTRNDREREEMLILAAKKYTAYCEALTHAKIYPFIYELPLQEIQDCFPKLASTLPSFAFLLWDESSQKYLTHLSRLVSALRWNMRQRIYPISVMSHKVIMTYIVYIIGMTGNQNGEQNDILSLLYRAIYHDVPEIITGDIVTPTKKAVPGFAELLEIVETEMMKKYFFRYISPEYTKFLSPYILYPFEGEEWKKAKYADILSALFEAKIEFQKWNSIFWEIYTRIYQEVLLMNHPGIIFLLAEVSSGFMDEKDDIIPPVSDL
jgi:putative hydrolases of HD superfamily